ncbi:hypothetical protein JK358_05425 [Nocardia sp. 2]|uniref:Uncharacterized protein n=1 Tax=Nocardia acididurans TaxID=2802282 RepID=A0ABS1LZI0_9NOCA|nr:hypothetical protein [Nocardia acididurans]MBL1073827.1 hypothetical protein [Nocardia acididurans]
MGIHGTAVIADTATRAEAEVMRANLRRLAVVTVDRCVLTEPHPVSNLWRASGFLELSVVEMVGADLFQGVRDARVVVADDLGSAGAVWSGWRVAEFRPEIIYRKYLPPPGGSGSHELAAHDRTDVESTIELARAWNADPVQIHRVAASFGTDGQAASGPGDRFAPWLAALGLTWPVPLRQI